VKQLVALNDIIVSANNKIFDRTINKRTNQQ